MDRPAGLTGSTSFLTEPAMALIGESQRSPQLDGRAAPPGYSSQPGDAAAVARPAQRPERPEPDQRARPAEPPGRGQRPEPAQRRQSEQRWPGQHWPDGLAGTALATTVRS